MVVQGKAIIMPTIPINAPQMDNDSRMIAGFRPVILPMTLGTINASCITCTMQKTSNAQQSIHQKFPPVSAALRSANKMVGTNATN